MKNLFATSRRLIHLLQILSPRQAVSFLRQWRAGLPLVCFYVRGIPTPLYIRRSTVDHKVVYQIFGLHDLAVTLNTPPTLVVDGGAHAGYAAVYFANRYPAAAILAVEPAARNHAVFRRNCQAYANIRLLEGAIWDQPGPLAITNPDHPFETGFQVGPSGSENASSFRGYTILELLHLSGRPVIDLLKLDIEGAEERLFAAHPEDWLPNVRALLIEIHQPAARTRIPQVLAEHGFSLRMTTEKYFFQRQ